MTLSDANRYTLRQFIAMTLDLCPCGRLDAKDRPFARSVCCGPCLDDFAAHPASDAESLMRSRYSAFVEGRADYLLATWHASRRPTTIDFEPGCKWLGLEIRRARSTGSDSAEVEFVARSRTAGRAQRLHEISRFVRQDGRWYYLDGDLL